MLHNYGCVAPAAPCNMCEVVLLHTAGSCMLDSVVSNIYELLGMGTQAAELSGRQLDSNDVLQVARQVN